MTRVIPFALAAAALWAALLVEPRVRAARPALRVDVVEGGEVLPPAFQLASTLLGSFRGLLVDFLWIRAEAEQAEGRYFAAAELARWIVHLQSRIEASWSYQAWNLGVNIPSVMPPGERWPYIEAALKLLWRDGLAANPSSLGLHYELAWFWLNRVGSDIDPAAPSYRAAVRDEVARVLGAPAADIREAARCEPLAAALRADPAVRQFLGDLAAAGAEDPDAGWIALWADPERSLGDAAPALRRALSGDPLLVAFDAARRAEAWREAFGFPIARARQVIERYGDLDVGSPEFFAVCWADAGLSKLAPEAVRWDALGLWRVRFSALNRAFRAGWMHLAAPIDDDYAAVIERVGADPTYGDQAPLFEEARRTNLRRAVTILYVNGWPRTAAALLARLRGLDPRVPAALAVDDFAFAALSEDFAPGRASRAELLLILKALCRQSLLAWGRGDAEIARAYYDFLGDLREAVVEQLGADQVPSVAALVGEARREAARERARARRGEAEG
jgi:hypothetical protein